ncbi:hypothetical protein AMECASPLE_028860 [Ameca splendens]|uniref:Uncharacterized protein n=1 Tax=Ameca splendens TaxID=208324 RepID=A0ABV1ABX1_9TELE
MSGSLRFPRTTELTSGGGYRLPSCWLDLLEKCSTLQLLLQLVTTLSRVSAQRSGKVASWVKTSPQHSLQLSLNSPGRQKTCTYLLGGRLAAESSTPARRSPEDPCLSALTETISDQSWTKTV